MALVKHSIPLLEYDDDPRAVIMPTHERLAMELPETAVFPFLGESVEAYARSHGAVQVGEFVSITKKYPVFTVEYHGAALCLCQAPMGAAASVQILDWLIGYGVKKVVSAGSCGALTDLPENTFLVPVKALRDEGTSYHYLPPSRYVEPDADAVRAIERTLKRLHIPCAECITWSTDGFYRETREKVAWRKEEGCTVVDMECAALAACARLRGVQFGQILFTADTLADLEAYDERDWGTASFDRALWLCLEAALEM